ncbi:helix-turn-helix domain-containing protein [Galbibacter pacificus]|uniref:helix-turn-helix domain-containing protein n=1 Tax=Galbibacter pacificus TaxID=2996052 RepID=UPI0030D1A2F6
MCKLTKLSSNGKSQTVKFIKKGDLLGQRSIVSEDRIKLSREELASIIGTATESIIRVVFSFSKEGLIAEELYPELSFQQSNNFMRTLHLGMVVCGMPAGIFHRTICAVF